MGRVWVWVGADALFMDVGDVVVHTVSLGTGGVGATVSKVIATPPMLVVAPPFRFFCVNKSPTHERTIT